MTFLPKHNPIVIQATNRVDAFDPSYRYGSPRSAAPDAAQLIDLQRMNFRRPAFHPGAYAKLVRLWNDRKRHVGEPVAREYFIAIAIRQYDQSLVAGAQWCGGFVIIDGHLLLRHVITNRN